MIFLWYYLECGTSYKDEMMESSAELVYATALKLPGECISCSLPNISKCSRVLAVVERHGRYLKPLTASRHSSCPVFISNDLFNSPCDFLRLHRVRWLL
ncbi:hypothetical protein NPIL_321451 [Nephila pilipes]|uniref:Uncharacterized protein n=1 Tax=Nephila pilipes TaxID=299642 RepID=A0A8X6U346_NEPPI|nr:hypothetical protein NPIL_321451 [Nephila pilipes]